MILRGNETIDVDVPGSSAMRMHLFRPAADGRFPGVLLFSEIYQVTAPIRRLAAMLAGHGHVVAVPEVYHEYEPAGTVLAYGPAGTDRGNHSRLDQGRRRCGRRRGDGGAGDGRRAGSGAGVRGALNATTDCARAGPVYTPATIG